MSASNGRGPLTPIAIAALVVIAACWALMAWTYCRPQSEALKSVREARASLNSLLAAIQAQHDANRKPEPWELIEPTITDRRDVQALTHECTASGGKAVTSARRRANQSEYIEFRCAPDPREPSAAASAQPEVER